MAQPKKADPMMSFFRRMQAPEELPVPIKNREKFDLAKRMELESILLLRNDECGGKKILPLNKADGPVAIFGNGHVVTNTGGGGSGGSMGSFRYSFIRGMNTLGAPYVKSLYEYYKAKADEGGGSYSDVHGWDTEDASLWGEPQYSLSGWNHAAPLAIPELMLDGGEIIDDGIVAQAAQETETAILFISRTVGTEEMDRGIPQPSDWYLNPSEVILIKQIADKFNKIILIINSSGSMDLTWTKLDWVADKIKAIVWSYGAGSYYGEALAELLYGRENFSAKLADTMTWRWEDHHTSKNFGGGQSYAQNGATGTSGFGNGGKSYSTLNGPKDPVSIYQEYIYTGYRYFDTFYGGMGEMDPVMYPFGYGLSYSTFSFDDMSLSIDGSKVTVYSRITNVSGPSGKEVMEVYVSCPNNKLLDQPYQKFITYAKTDALPAGGSMLLSVQFSLYDISSYSEDMAAYILEEGDYIIRLGNSSRNTQIAGIITVENHGKPVIVVKLSNRLALDCANPEKGSKANQKEFDALRLNSKLAGTVTIGDAAGDAKAIAALKPEQKITVSQRNIPAAAMTSLSPVSGHAPEDYVATLQSVVSGDISLHDFISQMMDEELIALLSGGSGIGVTQTYPDDIGVSLTNTKTKPSAPNSYCTGAGTSRSNRRLGIHSISYSDGSAGIPISVELSKNLNTDPNPAYPRAAGIACIWDPKLHLAWGRAIGQEMRASNVDIWLAPSINLHRNPLNGRNAEYYSEDPVLTGRIASYVSQGVAEQGLTVCLKHFAANDQEQYRRGRHTKASDLENDNLDAINSITSERALREVTLKPFEMAIKSADVRCIMSAFNKINGQYCASSRELLLDILRGEWDFKGFVVTDWGDYDEIANAADELENGNDMIMSGVHTRYSIPDQIRNGLKGIPDFDGVHTGTDRDKLHVLTREALERNAGHVLYTIMKSRNVFCYGVYNTSKINGSETPYHVKTELSILTTVLPSAAVGAEYSEQKVSPLLAGGDEGTKKYVFSISEKSQTSAAEFERLGLKLRGNGRITGKPVAGSAGSYKITFKVTSDFGSAEKELSLNIHNLAIKPDFLPGARLGVYYDQTVTVIGGTGKSALSMTGELPEGIIFEAVSGKISGYPSESSRFKTFSLRFTAVDSIGNTESKDYEIYVYDYIDVTLTPAVKATVETGQNVRIPISAGRNGSTDMCNFSVAYGELPEGLFAGGMIWMGYSISGTPLTPGVYDFGLKVAVSHSLPEISTIVPYTIEVLEAEDGELHLKTDSLPFGEVNEVYSAQITAAGGKGTKTYSLDKELSSAVLPTDLSVSASGLVTCSPMATDSGFYKVAVKVSDEVNANGKMFILPLYIGGVLEVAPAAGSTLNAEAGRPFNQVINTSGGFNGQYKYALNSASDSLPEGLALTVNPDYSAVISGIPALGTEGCYRLVIDIDEEFSGSPVATTIIYTLVVE